MMLLIFQKNLKNLSLLRTAFKKLIKESLMKAGRLKKILMRYMAFQKAMLKQLLKLRNPKKLLTRTPMNGALTLLLILISNYKI